MNALGRKPQVVLTRCHFVPEASTPEVVVRVAACS